MTDERYHTLMEPDSEERLTETEFNEGWHFCYEMDGLLRNNVEESFQCNCYKFWHRRAKHRENIQTKTKHMSNDQSPIAPPLNINLGAHVPSFPLLQNGTYHFKVNKVEVKSTSAGDGKYASVELKTLSPATSRTSEQLQAGVSVFETFNLVPTGKMRQYENGGWNMIADNLAPFIQSIEGGVPNATLGQEATYLPLLVGRTLKATIGYEAPGQDRKTGKSFKEKNVVTTWHKA